MAGAELLGAVQAERADRWNEIGNPKLEEGDRDIPMSPLVFNTLNASEQECPEGPFSFVFPTARGTSSGTQHLISGLGLGADRRWRHRCCISTRLWHFAAGFSAKWLSHANVQMSIDLYGHWFLSLEDDKAKFAAAQASIVA